MGRQQNSNSHSHQGQRDRSSSGGADLLNFHFSSGPPSQTQSNNNGRRRNQQNNHHHHNNNHQRRNSQQDRSAVRRKPNSHMFNLHSSADHAFVITRKGLKQQQYSFSGSDEAVSWESVKMVKVLVPSQQSSSPAATSNNSSSSTMSCPICLDGLVCARITKCGHVFCISCLLRHVQVHAQSNPYTHVKCPCCAVPLLVPDLRPVILVSSWTPKLHQRLKLVKLHRTKDCPSPYLPLPQQPKRSTTHAAPAVTDADAPFCRFNYIDPKAYQQHLQANKVELEESLKQLTDTKNVHPQLQYQNQVEAIFVTSALDTVQKELQKAVEEQDQEDEMSATFSGGGSGVYQTQPPHLVASNYEFVTAPLPHQQQQPAEGDDDATRRRSESIGSESTAPRRYRGDSIGSYASVDTSCHSQTTAEDAVPLSPTGALQQPAKQTGKRNNKPRKKQEFPKASMFLDDEGSTHFYQSEDGQLCFLSRFNMSCLLADFSPKVPNDGVVVDDVASMNFWQRRRLLPLPDTIEGEILEIENIHLTPEVRKRMPFLAHLPLYADIQFVELELHSLLSNDTKRKFKADFEKRRKRRQSKVKAEKREDKVARLKEEERINELKARMQQIDPNDEFFMVSPPPEEPVQLTGDAFGPAIATGAAARPAAAANVNAAFSFSNVIQSGGAALINAECNFPALGAPSPSPKRTQAQPAPTWGSPSRSNQPAPTSWGPPPQVSSPQKAKTLHEGVATGLPVSKQAPPVPGGKKKKKGKKIVLFSSGGQRGTPY
ncbi:RING finger protein 10 [Seminavis robusta]|uniref:RING finger protein 10 n=1 Tax=Seminavis robusta TaxID=568900 RepID=A0A9N8HD44_9STRA|nr:RING finger protein 10 [Seminavis robusta]|eukprot:Sro408_g137040.1 RING finger protein 10 (771) ;mRNA; r:53617-55929